MKTVKLPSGAVLKILNLEFEESFETFKAFVEVFESVKIDANTDVASLLTSLFVKGILSPRLETATRRCLGRCLYAKGANEIKADMSVFVERESRGDYLPAIKAVMWEAIAPFTSGLSLASSEGLFQIIEPFLKPE